MDHLWRHSVDNCDLRMFVNFGCILDLEQFYKKLRNLTKCNLNYVRDLDLGCPGGMRGPARRVGRGAHSAGPCFHGRVYERLGGRWVLG